MAEFTWKTVSQSWYLAKVKYLGSLSLGWLLVNRRFTLESLIAEKILGWRKFLGDCSCLLLGEDKALRCLAEGV